MGWLAYVEPSSGDGGGVDPVAIVGLGLAAAALAVALVLLALYVLGKRADCRKRTPNGVRCRQPTGWDTRKQGARHVEADTA
jgi:hypothetical protein